MYTQNCVMWEPYTAWLTLRPVRTPPWTCPPAHILCLITSTWHPHSPTCWHNHVTMWPPFCCHVCDQTEDWRLKTEDTFFLSNKQFNNVTSVHNVGTGEAGDGGGTFFGHFIMYICWMIHCGRYILCQVCLLSVDMEVIHYLFVQDGFLIVFITGMIHGEHEIYWIVVRAGQYD